jgi:hypothetical protein
MGWTIDKIKDANARAGQYFFEPATMRFFHSRILEQVYEGEGGVFFVTSERFGMKHPRLYTVRKFDPETSSVDTASKFQEFKTASGAKGAAERAAREATAEEDES